MSFPWAIDRLTLEPLPESWDFDIDFRRAGVQPNGAPDSRMDFSRGTEAWERGPSGPYRRAAHNLLVHSEDPTETDLNEWSHVRSSITGSTPPFKIVEDSSNNTHQLDHSYTKSAHSQDHYFEVVLAAAEREFASIYLAGTSNTNRAEVFVNLTTGEVSGAATNGSGVSFKVTPTATVDAEGRCTISGVWTIDGSHTAVFVRIITATDATTRSYQGDGSSGINFYRAQAGQYPLNTAYIKTTTSADYGYASDWDDNGVCLGARCEEASTNLITSSDDLSDWTLTRAAANVSSLLSPDGQTFAYELRDDNSGGGQNTVVATLAMTLAATTQYTLSAWVHPHTGDGWVSIDTNAFGLDTISYFQLTGAGVIGSTVGADVDDRNITAYSINGTTWYRIEVTFTTAADTAGVARLRLADADNSVSVDMDGTSVVAFWGVQCEVKARATSRIFTKNATSARSADDYDVSAANLGYASDGPISAVIGWSETERSSSGHNVLAYYLDALDSIRIRGGSATTMFAEDGNVVQVNAGPAGLSYVDGQAAVVAFRYDTNDVFIAANDGDTIATHSDNAATIPSAIPEVQLGRVSTTSRTDGYLTQFKHSNLALPDAVLLDAVAAA